MQHEGLQAFQTHLAALDTEARDSLEAITHAQDLPAWYRVHLGRKGTLTDLLHRLSTLPAAERPQAGQAANRLKRSLEAAFQDRQQRLQQAAMQASLAQGIDTSLPGRPFRIGRLHPSTRTLRQITSIFGELGFEVYEAPEVDTEENNFSLLNIPPYHPARDMWDTFWVGKERVLRTHTSPGQIRCMRERHPQPVRVILPGKCYRYEAISARSEHQFFQVEGMAIGKRIRLTDLIGTLKYFAQRMYGTKRKVRVRGSYFPFTEPSIEIDMDCILCASQGCRVCKHSGWLEIAGAGMMHPQVLRNGGYDSDCWSGFAFGMGVERPTMLQHHIEDIRLFYENDLRFLQQF